MALSCNLSYLLGVLRDGCLSKSGLKTEVTLAADLNLEWLSYIAGLAADEFSLPKQKFKAYKVWDRKSRRQCYRLKVYSKRVFDLLTSHYSEKTQLYWNTPKAIACSAIELQKRYIAGFYDAEGGCRNVDNFLSGKTKTLHCWASIRCKHEGFNEPLNYIKMILSSIGITSSIYDSDELVMTGKRNLSLFYKTIPLKHGQKRDDLKKLLIFARALSADA